MPLPLRLNKPGPVIQYLEEMIQKSRQMNRPELEDVATEYRLAIQKMLNTPSGAMLLELLEKATTQSILPITTDDRALAARNAQAFILSDLRRIASNESDMVQRIAEGSAGRARRRNPGPGSPPAAD